MKSIIASVIFGLLLTFVQCGPKFDSSEYVIKQGLFSGGRTYEIKGKNNPKGSFTIKNELLSVGKKLILLENGKPRYTVKHDILHLMSHWTITDVAKHHEVAKIKHEIKLVGSKIVAEGEFGQFVIEGHFRNHSFTIKKNGRKVAEIEKKSMHIHDTYGLTVFGDVDQALMVLFTIIVDEIREH